MRGFRTFLASVAVVGTLFSSPIVEKSHAVTDDGTCRRIAREYGYSKTPGTVEMNLTGCVYSRTKGYYVPRSGYCNLKARYIANKWPYPRDWEIAQRIKRSYDCDAMNNGIYFID